MKFIGSNGEEKMLPVAKHLTTAERKLFFSVYANHNRSMGLEKRANYTLADVLKIESYPEEKCLHVHYKNGDWWHYSIDGNWY